MDEDIRISLQFISARKTNGFEIIPRIPGIQITRTVNGTDIIDMRERILPYRIISRFMVARIRKISSEIQIIIRDRQRNDGGNGAGIRFIVGESIQFALVQLVIEKTHAADCRNHGSGNDCHIFFPRKGCVQNISLLKLEIHRIRTDVLVSHTQLRIIRYDRTGTVPIEIP